MSRSLKLLKIDPKHQAAIDRLVTASKRHKKKDEAALVQCWWDDYGLGKRGLEIIVFGMWPPSDDWSDHQLIDYERISKAEITDGKRIQFAREMILRRARQANEYELCAFETAKIKSSNGKTAWAVFQVRGGGQGGFDVNCFGVFRNLKEFWKRFREEGWIGVGDVTCAEDTKGWISNKEILKRWSKD